MRKPQRGLPSFCCHFEKINIAFNGKFVTELAILKSNYLPMKLTQDMKLRTIIHYILLDIIGYPLYLAVKCLSRYEIYSFTSYALLAITELPNNELTGIHTLNLSPLFL